MEILVIRRPEEPGDPRRASPWAERVLTPLEGRDKGVPRAALSTLNLLAGAVPGISHAGDPPRLIAWSGWLPEDSTPEDGCFRTGFETWGPEGRRRFEELCDWLGPRLRDAGRTLVLRPHARHVLSDIPSCLSFAKARAGQPFELLIEPAALLTPDTLRDAPEHIERIVSAATGLECLWGFLVGGIARTKPDGELRLISLCEGDLDPEIVSRAVRQAAGSRPVVVYETLLPRQLGFLRPAGRR